MWLLVGTFVVDEDDLMAEFGAGRTGPLDFGASMWVVVGDFAGFTEGETEGFSPGIPGLLPGTKDEPLVCLFIEEFELDKFIL